MFFETEPYPVVHYCARFLFFLPLLKTIKLKFLFHSLQTATLEAYDLDPSIFKVIIFMVWMLLVSHIMALGWISIGAVDPVSIYMICDMVNFFKAEKC